MERKVEQILGKSWYIKEIGNFGRNHNGKRIKPSSFSATEPE